jgi:mono/diheme cytochrome c family protein
MRALFVFAVAVTLSLGACASPRRGAPIAGPISLSASAQEGRVLYMHNCHQCHPFGEGGLGPAINNKPLPSAVMKLQIRTGVLGSMPAFGKSELSEDELDRVVEYLKALRHKGS